MFEQLGVPVALSALLLAGSLSMARGSEKDKREEEAKQCLKLVNEELSKLKGDRAKVDAVTKAPLDRVFPDTTFCSVLYRRYPVAIVPPESLAPSSLYAVPHAADGKRQALTNADQLEEYFKSKSRPIRNADDAKDVLRAWLELAQVFEQDGYYKFEILEDSLKVTAAADSGRKASGRVIVTAGGNGELTVTLIFDANGKLTKVQHSAKLKPGPRPRCQATKLLDADPIVRGMAEDTLLYMGPPAKDYLDEQRARATPELRAAIDRIWRRICEEK